MLNLLHYYPGTVTEGGELASWKMLMNDYFYIPKFWPHVNDAAQLGNKVVTAEKDYFNGLYDQFIDGRKRFPELYLKRIVPNGGNGSIGMPIMRRYP